MDSRQFPLKIPSAIPPSVPGSEDQFSTSDQNGLVYSSDQKYNIHPSKLKFPENSRRGEDGSLITGRLIYLEAKTSVCY